MKAQSSKANSISFNAVPDPTAKVMAIGIAIVGLLGLVVYSMWKDMSFFHPLMMAGVIFFLALGLADEIFMPRKYILGTNSIVVERKFWKTSILMPVILRVELLDKSAVPKRYPVLPLGWRSFLGSYGKFIVSGKGVWTFHTHRTERFVLIHTYSAGIIAISPEPAGRFVSQAQDILKMRILGRSS